MIRIECNDVAKFYGKTEVFRKLHFDFEGALCIGIQGPNGSGKSTLLKCLSGMLRPSEGDITWKINGKNIDRRMIRYRIGFAAPYLHLYNELSVSENLIFLWKLRTTKHFKDAGQPSIRKDRLQLPSPVTGVPGLMDVIGLSGLSERTFGTLSSGQQQRVKLAGALISAPPILMLDEPGTNLDEDGIALVADLINRQKETGGMIFLASNRKEELALCNETITLSPAPE